MYNIAFQPGQELPASSGSKPMRSSDSQILLSGGAHGQHEQLLLCSNPVAMSDASFTRSIQGRNGVGSGADMGQQLEALRAGARASAGLPPPASSSGSGLHRASLGAGSQQGDGCKTPAASSIDLSGTVDSAGRRRRFTSPELATPGSAGAGRRSSPFSVATQQPRLGSFTEGAGLNQSLSPSPSARSRASSIRSLLALPEHPPLPQPSFHAWPALGERHVVGGVRVAGGGCGAGWVPKGL